MKYFNITIVLCLAIIAAIFFFPPPQNSSAACNPPYENMSCCGDVAYYTNTQICCDGTVFDGQCCPSSTTNCIYNGSITGSIENASEYVCWNPDGEVTLFATASATEVCGTQEVVTINSDCSVTTNYNPVCGPTYTWEISGPDYTNGVGLYAHISTTNFGTYTATFHLDATNRPCPPPSFPLSINLYLVKTEIDVWDGDGRHAVSNLLAVVPPLSNESLNGKATLSPDVDPPEGSPEWDYRGVKRIGKEITYSNSSGLNGYTDFSALLAFVTPVQSVITCECVDEGVALKAYPVNKSYFFVDTGPLNGIVDDIIDVLTLFFPLPGGLTFETPRITFDLENQWKEQNDPKTNLAGWTFLANIEAIPLYSLEAELSVKPKVLKKGLDKIEESRFGKWMAKYFVSVECDLAVAVNASPCLSAVYTLDEYGIYSVELTGGNNMYVPLKGEGALGITLLPSVEDLLAVGGRSRIEGGFLVTNDAWFKDQSFGVGTQISTAALKHYQKFYASFMGHAVQWPLEGEEETILIPKTDFDRRVIELFSW